MNKKAPQHKQPKAKMGRIPFDVDALRVKIFYEAPKGYDDGQLAKFLGISETTYYELKKHNPDFSDSIKFYRKITAVDVLKSFTKVACGFNYDETTSELKKNQKTGKMEMVVTKIVTKEVVPNAAAGIFYLKNQMDKEFREKIENTHTFESALDNITLVFKVRE